MKSFLITCGIILAGYLGYKLEPDFRLRLTGRAPAKPVATPAPGQPAPVAPAAPSAPVPAIDLSTLTPSQLPAQVLLKAATEVSEPNGTLKLQIAAGNKVRLIRLESDTVVVGPGTGNLEGRVLVANTDLLEQLAANPPPAPAPPPAVPATPDAQPGGTPAGAATGTEPTPPAPAVVPDPAPQPQPEPPAVTPGPAPEPAPAPAVATDPAPTGSTPAAGATDIVKLMKDSILAGGLKDVEAKHVQGFQAGEPETVEGVTYQTGLVRYTQETIFGMKNLEAKALIKDGALVKWVWPKSGMEVK